MPPDASRLGAPRPPDDDLEATFILKPAPVALPSVVPPPDSPSRSAPSPPRRSPALLIAAAAGIAVLICATAWLLLRPAETPPAVAVQIPELPLATEAEIAGHRADRLTVFRLRDNPRIVVLDYPNLTEQGLALNRLAAFIEKAEVPKDRVLDDASLAREISKTGDTVDSYYYGHDYAVPDIIRFFALADRDRIALSPQELALRALIARHSLDAPGPAHAIITVSQAGGEVVDDFTRRIILRHELSHGEYFTNPAYAAYVLGAWNNVLTAEERAAFIKFLGDQNYDTANTNLMANEMQAFLVFTPDSRYIGAEKLGLTPAAYAGLRERFIAGMPDGWLRRLADAPLP